MEKTLRELALRVKDIANEDIQTERMTRWKNLNSLKKGRPLVQFIPAPQIMSQFVAEESLICEDEALRDVERELHWRIFKNENFQDDEPITTDIFIPLHKHTTHWMQGQQTVRMGKDFSSSHFKPCLVEYKDFEKMSFPKLVIDREKSNKDFERVKNVVGDIINVQQGKPFDQTCGWGESMIDELVEMRGLEQIYVDMYENPQFIHDVMEFMTQGKEQLMQQYIQENALFLNNRGNFLGSCGLAYTDELPTNDFDGEVCLKDLWGFAQAQEFSSVSPAMLDEFVLPYEQRLVKDFGLLLYGCCEPMQNNIEKVVARFPNLRAFSIGPFTNHEKAAIQIADKFVYTWKQNPSYITAYDPEFIQNEIKETFRVTKDCRVAIVLMDTYDFGEDIGRLKEWIRIASAEAQKYEG